VGLTPADVPLGDTGDPGHQQAVTVGHAMIRAIVS
jgi:hypothetical protein